MEVQEITLSRDVYTVTVYIEEANKYDFEKACNTNKMASGPGYYISSGKYLLATITFKGSTPSLLKFLNKIKSF